MQSKFKLTANSMTLIDKDDFLIKSGKDINYMIYMQSITPYEWHKELFDFAKKSK